MTSRRKRRLLLLLIVMLGAGAASELILYALRQNINLFYKPAEIFAQVQLPRQRIRIGGMVRKGSVRQLEGLTVNFTMTDYKQDLQVLYTGVLPDLFK
ncbi:MAG TPA: cytochrome c maturation protein CcmE, partial [Gammaproteobacteria bacterium]|nr:cytochrome c maturation protein CcmE [Gammaproteobacteria bacterium]